MKYYDFSRMWQLHPDYGVIVGGRSNGKSYATGKQWIMNYLETGAQFVRVVRYLFDMQSKYVADYFSADLLAWVSREYGYEIWYEAPNYYIAKEGKSRKGADVLGQVLSLSNEQKYKSNQYDRVTVIDIEEFALLDPTLYLQGEIDKFQSLLSTIVRMRNNVTVWFVGNTISKYNPYFTYLNINIDRLRLKPGDLRIVPQPNMGYDETPTVAIEFAEMAYETSREIPRLFKLSGNTTATTGLFELPPDIFEPDKIKFEEGHRTFVVQVGDVKFKLHAFACFCYWQLCQGKDKTLRPDMIVKSMCYDKNRYFWNVIKGMKNPLPTEMYYDHEDTKQYIYDNILKNWKI